MKHRLPRGLIVALGFLAIVGVSILIAVVFGPSQPFAERCSKYCQSIGKQGEVVAVYPRTMTGARDGPVNCECR
jgi:hypothetical protein